MRMLTSSPAIGSGIRPNCEAYGYLLDANGSCAYIQAYNREVAAHPGARRVSVMDKTCQYPHAQLRLLDLRALHLPARRDTSRKLEDGNYEIPVGEHIFGTTSSAPTTRSRCPD